MELQPEDIIAVAIKDQNVNNSGDPLTQSLTIWVGTEIEYARVDVKDERTLYFIHTDTVA